MLRISACLSMTLGVVILAGAAAAQGVSSGKDLLATIVLNGQTCDQVVDAKRNADSDYTATCKDGNRYRVFVNSSGRVIVQKL